MGFGFVIERSGTFFLRHIAAGPTVQSTLSFWIGITFLLVGTLSAIVSEYQYKSMIASVEPEQVPPGYSLKYCSWINWFTAFLGIALIALLIINFAGVR